MQFKNYLVFLTTLLLVACSPAPIELADPIATRTKPPTWTPEPSLEPSATFSPPPPSPTYTATPQLNLTLAAQQQQNLETTFGPVSTRPASEPGKIVYGAVETLKSSQIFVMDSDGTNQQLLVSGDDELTGFPVWSPDGNLLAFLCGAQICVSNYDGSGYRKLTSNESFKLFPTWHPEGLAVAFVNVESESGSGINIYSVDATGGAVSLVLPGAYAASWSPDGSQIAYIPFNELKQGELFIRASQGGDSRSILDMEVATFAWSPDGEYLALTVNELGFGNEHEIYIIRPDGTGAVKLTDNDWDDVYPMWSPDGTQIVFSSAQYGHYDIFVMDADGSNLRRLTTSILDETTPSWQPEPE